MIKFIDDQIPLESLKQEDIETSRLQTTNYECVYSIMLADKYYCRKLHRVISFNKNRVEPKGTLNLIINAIKF